MAADVRNDNKRETDDLSSEGKEENANTSCQTKDDHIEKMPSHSIVYQQMRDVVHMQKLIAQENELAFSCSQKEANSTFEKQKKKIQSLELSLQNEYVPKQDLDELKEKLKEERDTHKESLKKLKITLDKLDASQKQVAELALQMEQEKTAWSKSCDSMREDLDSLKIKNRELNSIIEEKNRLCEDLQGLTLVQKQEIGQMKSKHTEEQRKLRSHISEAEIEKQQEAYLRELDNQEKIRKARKTKKSM